MEMADELRSLIRRPLERLWYALTGERIEEIVIQGLIEVFVKSLENKEFVVKKAMADIPIEKLEEEPMKVASELLVVLENAKRKRKD